MNAIQLKERVDFYNDTTRNGRFMFVEYNKAVKDAIKMFIDEQFGDEPENSVVGFQRNQQIRDNLYTLIKTQNPTVTTVGTITSTYCTSIQNHVDFPADYYLFVSMMVTIGGYKNYARPTTYNEIGPELNDTFRKPTNSLVYYNENSTGLNIYRGDTGTLSSVDLTYLKTPADFSVGDESKLINYGASVLTTSSVYIATEVSVHNSVTYQPGDQFTAVNATLTSGQVILASNTTACDLPAKVHERIAKIASGIMCGVISDFNKSAYSEKEANKG